MQIKYKGKRNENIMKRRNYFFLFRFLGTYGIKVVEISSKAGKHYNSISYVYYFQSMLFITYYGNIILRSSNIKTSTILISSSLKPYSLQTSSSFSFFRSLTFSFLRYFLHFSKYRVQKRTAP